jgi:HECT-domain (ubiquitin-transferase)
MIEDLRLNSKDLSEEDFEFAVDEYWVTLLSNG